MTRHHMEVFNRSLHYDLDLEKKITIVKGNSGTGKTQLIRLVSEYCQYGISSGVTVVSDLPCAVLTSEDWQIRLQHKHGNVIFIDQNNAFLTTSEFSDIVNHSDNWFVIISRESIPEIPDDQKETCILKETSHNRNNGIICNELVRIS